MLSVTPEITVFDEYYMELFDGTSAADFGSVPVGCPVQQSFSIENWGTGDLTLDPNSLSLPSGFSVVTPFGGTVQPGYSTSFTIQLDAATAGSYGGALSFSTNDSDENPFDFTLSGEVTAASEISVFDDQSAEVQNGFTWIYFDNTTAGAPVTETLTIQNTGIGDLTLDSASLVVPNGFSVVTPFAGVVAPGQSTTFTLQSDASMPGYFSGSVSFANNDSDENPFEFYVSSDVTGAVPEIVVTVDGGEVSDDIGQVAFGSTTVGLATNKTFTIENSGAGELTLDTNSLSLPNGFSLVAPFAPSVQASGSTTFTVQLDASVSGTFSGELSFLNSDGDENPFNFAISGDVADVGEPEIEVVDASQAIIADGTGSVGFGSTPEGTAVEKTYTVKNLGTAELTLDTASLTVPSGFSVVSSFAATVASGGSTTFTVRLDATAAGSYGGAVSFTSNDTDESPYDFTVAGEVTTPVTEIEVVDASQTGITDGTGSVDFGSTPEGTALEKTFTVKNTGTADLTLDVPSLTVPSGFSVVTSFASTVAPGASTSLTVRLDAVSVGSYGGTLSFANNDDDENPYDFAVSGNVFTPEPEIQVIDTSLMGIADGTGNVDFGSTVEGIALEQTFTIKNAGTAILTLDTVSLSVPSGFSVVTPFGSTVAPDESTSLTIRLDAIAAGSFGGTVSFANNDNDESPFDFVVSGEVTTPTPEIEVRDASQVEIADGTGSVDFGSTPEGTAVEKTFTVKNTGTADLTLDVPSLTVPSGFSVVTSFASTVAPGASTSLTVRLDAVSVGSYGGTLSFANSDDDENPYDFAVSGEVVAAPEPEIQVLDMASIAITDDTGSVDFGSTFVGSAVEQTFSINNLGAADLTLDSASLSVPTGFSVVTTFAETLVPGSSTSFTVRLDAAATGSVSGTLSFTSNDTDENPFDFTVSGQVVEPEPEIEVTTISWDDISDGTGSVDFASTPIGTPAQVNLWIHNTGEGDLTLDRESLVLPVGFSVYSWFAETVTPDGKTLFIIQMDASDSGVLVGQLSFTTNDADEGLFNFAVSGEVLAATGPVTVDDFGLFKDTGTSDTDQVTANPMLVGVVNGDFGGGYVHLEFDHDQDHTSIAGSVEVLSTASDFLYDPRETDPSLAEFVGSVSIHYRVVEYDATDNVVATGDWCGFTYTLEAAPDGGPNVSNLRLLDDTGDSESDGVTSDPTLVVDVPGSSGSSAVVVEFEVDGVVKGETGADSGELSVTYFPKDVEYGVASTLRARGKSWSLDYGMFVYGNWTDTITITLRQDTPSEIVELRLSNDTGESSTDKVTSDATLTGYVDPNATGLVNEGIQFDHDGDDVVDGSSWTNDAGSFTYAPTGLQNGVPTTIRARSSRWDSIVEEHLYGLWYSFTFTYEAVAAATVSELKLGLPLPDQENVTGNPMVHGELAGDNSVALVRVEFDHDGDGVVDGSTISDEEGAFTYYVTGLTPGPDAITVRARTSQWDENLAGYAYSDWTSLEFTLQAAANEPMVIETLALLNDTGEDGTDSITNDSALTGQLSNDGSVAFVRVEFQESGSPIGYTLSDAEGHFAFSPSDLAAGELTVQARAREWDYAAGDFIYSDWVSLSFTLEAVVVSAPTVDTLGLLCDTGASQTDTYTANTMLTGSLSDDGDVAGLTVEFDHDGTDGVDEVDGVTSTDLEGVFHYRPAALSFGQQTIQARAKRWDVAGQTWLVGGWTQVVFNYEDQPNVAPVLVALELANDTGTDNSDNVTSDPSLAGRIINEGALEGVTVELDYDSDQTTDQSTTADLLGKFALTPGGLAYGSVTIHARTREFDDVSGQFLYGGWTSLAFTYEEAVNAPAEVDNLALAYDLDTTGTDPRATNPALTGLVTNDGPVAGLLVQFDHDSDGITDASVTTNADGNFTYQPAGLELGTVAIRARAKEYDDLSTVLYGAWYELQFTLEAPSGASVEVSQLGLANDTGQSSTDDCTDDATLTGQISGPGGLAGVTVQFDHDGDDVMDGTATTDVSGAFSYAPEGLEEGRVTVRARTFNDDGEQPEYGSWTSLSFVFSSEPDGTDAQDLAAAYSQFDADWQAAAGNYDDATAAAQLAYLTDLDAAAAQYDATIAAAGSTRGSTVDTATATYDAEVAAAEAAYASAMDAASATFATDLAGFIAGGGDSASYHMEEFVWPDAPADGAPDIEFGGDGEGPPVAAPAYSGTPYDFQADPAYRDAVAAAYAAYSELVQTVSADYRAAVASAETEYELAVATASTDAYSSADAAYLSALAAAYGGASPTHTGAAWTASGLIASGAHSAYTAAVEAAEATYNAAVAAATAAMTSECAVASQAFNDAVSAGADSQGPVRLTLETAIAAAGAVRDRAVFAAKRILDQNLATIEYIRDKAEHAGQEAAYQEEITYSHWLQSREALLAREYALAAADVALASAESIALAEQIRADAVALAEWNQSVSLAAAVNQLRQDLVTAKQTSAAAWAAAEDTPWADYMSALVDNEALYVSNTAGKYLTYVTALADALRTETQTINAAFKAEAEAVAAATESRASALATAEGTLEQDTISAAEIAALRVNTNLRVAFDAYSEAAEAFDIATAAADEVRDLAIGETIRKNTLDLTTAEVNRHVAFLGYEPPGSGGGGGDDEYDDIIAAYDEAIEAAYSEYVAGMAISYCDHDLSRINAEEIREHAENAATRECAIDSNAAEWIRAVSVADAIEARDRAISAADAAFDVSVATAAIDLEDVVARSTGALGVAWVNALTTYQGDMAGSIRDLAIADANVEKDLVVSVAFDYGTAVSDWALTRGTAWSGYVEALAVAELPRATALATAGVSRVDSVAGAGHMWTLDVTSARRTFAGSENAAWVDRIDSITSARTTHATGMGAAWENHGNDVAEALAERSADRALGDEAFANAQAIAEETLDNALGDADRDYLRVLAETGCDQTLVDCCAWTGPDPDIAGRNAAALNEKTLAEAEAKEVNTVALAAATRDHIFADAAAEVAFTDGLVTAADALAAEVESLGVARAAAVSAADILYVDSTSTAAEACDIAMATADHTYTNAVASAVADLNTARAAAAAVYRESAAFALGEYEVSLYTDHRDSVAAAYSVDPTLLGDYRLDVATADVLWAEGLGTHRNAYHDDLSILYSDYTSDLNTASTSHVSGMATADLDFRVSQSGIDAAWTRATGAALANWDVASTTAKLAQFTAEVAAKGNHMADTVSADAARDEAVATAQFGFQSAVAAAQKLLDVQTYTTTDYTAAVAAATGVLDTDVDAAELDHVTARGEAGVTLADSLGTAGVAFATAYGDADVAFTTAMNSADAAYASGYALAENAWTSASASAETTYVADLGLADQGLVDDLGAADVAYATALGTLDRDNITSVAEAEADYHVDTTAEKAAETAAWALGEGTPEADFLAARAQAQADWVSDLVPDYVALATAHAQAEADYAVTLTGRMADLDTQAAAQFATFSTAAAGSAATHWTSSTAEWLSYEESQIGRQNTLFEQDSVSGRQYGIDVATGGKTSGVAVANAEKTYMIASHLEVSSAESDRDAALAAADQDYDVAVAGAKLAWTTGVVGAETAYLTGEATAQKDMVVALAGLDKNYTIALAGHASTADNDDAADLVAFRSEAESAQSALFADQSAAWADFRSAAYTAEAAALDTLADTLDTPWAHFQADLAAVRSDWWTATKPAYLAWVADTNLAHETYEAAVGTEYVALVAATTAADVAFITASAGAEETRVIAWAGAQESYLLTMISARQTYLVDAADAEYDLAVDEDSSAHAAAVRSVADAYRITAATGSGDRRVAFALADVDYTNTLHGPGGASLAWRSAHAAAIKSFTIGEATAYADLVIDLAEVDRDFGIASAEAYSDAVATLIGTSPWGTLAAAEAEAAATRAAAVLNEGVLFTIAQATGARDEAIATATAAEAVAIARAEAESAVAVAFAGAALTRAEEEAAAEIRAGGAGVDVTPLPYWTITPADGTIEAIASEWATDMMASVPPEEWDDWVEDYINSVLIFGEPIPEDIAEQLRAWIAAEQSLALRDPLQEALDDSAERSVLAIEPAEIAVDLTDATLPFEIEWLGEWDESEKTQVIESLRRIRALVQALIDEINRELSTLPPDLRKEFEFELRHLLARVLEPLDRLLASEDFLLRLRYYDFREADPDLARINRFGVISLHDGERLSWKDATDKDLDRSLFHELTHIFNTLDNRKWGTLFDAGILDRLLHSGLISSTEYGAWKTYAEYKLSGHPRAEIYPQPYLTDMTWGELISRIKDLWVQLQALM